MNMNDTPEWLRLLRGFPAYYLHAVLHRASFALLPYAGDWAYRHERQECRRATEDETPLKYTLLTEGPVTITVGGGGGSNSEPARSV